MKGFLQKPEAGLSEPVLVTCSKLVEEGRDAIFFIRVARGDVGLDGVDNRTIYMNILSE